MPSALHPVSPAGEPHPRTILRTIIEPTQDDPSALHFVLDLANGHSLGLRLPLDHAEPLARQLSAAARGA
jgi:hypothetical protein